MGGDPMNPKHYEWQDDAACAGMNDFTQLRTPAQREICEDCPVINQCLRDALKWDAQHIDELPTSPTYAAGWPVYGGKTVLERMYLPVHDGKSLMELKQQETAA
jgi:hypothetical protein